MKASVVAALLLVSVLGAAPVLAGTLDPQLAALLNGKPAVTRAHAGQPASSPALFAPHVDADGRVQVYVHPENDLSAQSLAARLPAFGAKNIRAAPLLRVVQAWIPVNELAALAVLPFVHGVSVPAYAHVLPGNRHWPVARSAAAAATARAVSTGLSIDSQAPAAMQALTLIANGANGAGVKVGVMSGDISGLAASQAAGYLPAAVWDDPGYPGTSPVPGNPAEGTALLEIVHAVAPQASLGFCAPVTSVDMLTCFKDFIQWGATVIVNDMQLHTTDMFAAGFIDDGSVAWAAEQIAEANPGVAFVNIAGNEAQDYFQAPYTPGPGAMLNGSHYDSLMDFGAATGGASNTRLPVQFNYVSGFAPVLEWNDPLKSNADSFVMALVDQNGNVLAIGTPFTTDDGRPGVSLSYVAGYVNQPAFLEIACQSCPDPVTLKLDGFADGAATFGLNTAGAVGYGQAVIPGTLTVAAASVRQLDPLGMVSEFFTGTGPFLYGDYTATATEAKPDLSGIDDVTVSGAGGFDSDGPAAGGGANFLGTSAAVPNIAGLLADLMSGVPGLPASSYYAALKGTANQSAFPAPGAASAFNAAAAGAGLAQGVGAWNALSSRTIPYVTAADPPSVMPGSAFSINVSGFGFVNGASVNFNGTALPTTFLSSFALSAEVPATLAAASGVFNLSVTNPNPANTVSNTVSYVLGKPVPGIASWSPQQVTAGSPAFTLAVHGTDFMQGAAIRFGGNAVPTTYVSATQLTAVVPASAVAQAGDYPLVVVNPAPGGTSAGVNFSVGAPAPAKSSGGGGGGGNDVLLLLLLLGLTMVRVMEVGRLPKCKMN